MRLEITRRADLATRALLDLLDEGQRTKSVLLAGRLGTTSGFLSQVMAPLVANGWVQSEPGPAGGYTASLDPHAVDVLQIIEAVEGPTETGRCVMEDRACSRGTLCALHRPWSDARAQLVGELSATPLSSLIAARPA